MYFNITDAHLGILRKFESLKGQEISMEYVKGKNGNKLQPDEYVSEEHILHDCIRGFYKPKGWECMLSYCATEKEENYGKQIEWSNYDKGEFKKIVMNPPAGEKDNRKISDIKSAIYAMENKIPIGILFNYEKSKRKVLGLGIIDERDKDGNFIVYPTSIDSAERNLKLSNNYYIFKTSDKDLVQNNILDEQVTEFEFIGLPNYHDEIKEGDIVFLVLGGDKPPWEIGLRGIAIVKKSPYDRGYSPKNKKYFKVLLEKSIIFKTSITRKMFVPYKNTYDMPFIGPTTKGEPNQANVSTNEEQVVAALRGVLDYGQCNIKDIENIFGKDIKELVLQYKDIFIIPSYGSDENNNISVLNLDYVSNNFIENIKSQKMNKSYKIALLSAFVDNEGMKNILTYDEIVNFLKEYYSIGRHREDLREIVDLESWGKNEYISKMQETAMKYLPKEYFILDKTNETYRLCDEISKYVSDLNFIKAYKEAVEFLENKYFDKKINEIILKKKDTNKSKEEVINHIYNYINNQGYEYDKELISNIYISLKTKPFVILAGISGTGKSKIVRLFAESLGATVENNQFNMISVRPDWNDSTELIGYKNLESKFIKGKLTQIIEKASQNLDKPYFVCLDEMNLARVEYYLSDYLSVIESRRKVDDKIVTDKLIYDSEIDEEETLSLPENLYIVGTVNMDDTTFQFSRKVLDRANTIEFSEVNLENLFGENSEEDNLDENIEVYNDFLKSTYLKTIDIEDEYRDYAIEINKKIIDINNILKKSQKQFAYRVRDEILFYMIENKKANLLDENEAFDYQIMQKVLPAISGSENSVKETLVNLFNFVCEKEILNDSDIEEAEQFLNSQDIKYKKSAEKIIYMLKGYNYDGYASYWY